MELTFPVEVSRRLPQSVQKTRDPIADILNDNCRIERQDPAYASLQKFIASAHRYP